MGPIVLYQPFRLVDLSWHGIFDDMWNSNKSTPVSNFAIVNLWKAAGLAFYILSTLFVDSFVIIFVVTVILAALDFWVVKNISGRILVGLRWWNEINEQGESLWKFECLDQQVRNYQRHACLMIPYQLYCSSPQYIFIFGYTIFSCIVVFTVYNLVLPCSHWLGWTKRIRGYFGGHHTLV